MMSFTGMIKKDFIEERLGKREGCDLVYECWLRDCYIKVLNQAFHIDCVTETLKIALQGCYSYM